MSNSASVGSFTVPFVQLLGSGSWKKSKVIPKTLNPNWNESFILNVGSPETDLLELRVFDKDLILDDSIGAVAICLDCIAHDLCR